MEGDFPGGSFPDTVCFIMLVEKYGWAIQKT